ncbi:MAG: hypothetical protein Q8R92_19335, partial [Deltaproteobacteria bacterium]|nr:hypothetical protein [Deltaproteobacteria bacterium]
MARVEVLESRSPEFRALSGGQDTVSLYDLQVTRHPSYSVSGLLVHNSSILKSFDGRTRGRLIEMFAAVPYRLCCTATPAPNDIAELTNHCEFLGIMTRAEMLATFFVHTDDANHGQAGWRLKRHAREAFYRWLASWGMFLRRPSDLAFSDEGYDLPPLEVHDVIVKSGAAYHGEYLFPGMGLGGIHGRMSARRGSLKPRVDAVVSLVENTPGAWVVWCGLNDESREVAARIPGAQEVTGSDSLERKTRVIEWFSGKLCLCQHAKLNLSTCVNGPDATEIESESMSERGRSKGTRAVADGMLKTPSIGKGSRLTSEGGNMRTRQRDSDNGSGAMGSPWNNSTNFSIRKGVAAPSALSEQPVSGLTTTMRPRELEVYSATPAISGWESSEITQSCSGELPCMCGHRSGRRILITKPAIFGHGMNWQHCHQMAFLGLGDSYETYYQAIRRCWRYGQTRPVAVHVVVSEGETEIVANVRKKEQEAGRMAEGLIKAVRDMEREEVGMTV